MKWPASWICGGLLLLAVSSACSSAGANSGAVAPASRAEDIVQIQQVLHAHQIYIDERDPAAYAGLYAANGSYESVFGRAAGFEELRAMSEHLHEIGFTAGKRHMVGPAKIEFISDDEATALSYWWVADTNSPPTLFATGVYRDRLEHIEGEWKIVSRVMEADQ